MSNIRVIREQCVGCEACVGACLYGAITMNAGVAEISEACTLCGACVTGCNFEAIELQRDSPARGASASHAGIWVFVEQREGKVRGVSYELLGEATRLAVTLGAVVSAIFIGEGIASIAEGIIHYGADEVYVVDRPDLRHFNDELYADIFAQLIEKHRPEIVLMGATTYGRSLAPRVASRLNTGLTADCTELAIDKETKALLQTRPAFGGNLMATILCPHHRPQMATVRPRVMKALEPDYGRIGQIHKVDLPRPETLKTRVLEVVSNLSESINLAEAEVIVAVGKGIESSHNLDLIKEFTSVLGGAMAASRPVVDAGWMDVSLQIGQTGKTVAPKLYLACGISGAVQHLVGMSSAEVIVAINKDPEAPIFEVAHYGIVGDVMEVIPALIEEIKTRLS